MIQVLKHLDTPLQRPVSVLLKFQSHPGVIDQDKVCSECGCSGHWQSRPREKGRLSFGYGHTIGDQDAVQDRYGAESFAFFAGDLDGAVCTHSNPVNLVVVVGRPCQVIDAWNFMVARWLPSEGFRKRRSVLGLGVEEFDALLDMEFPGFTGYRVFMTVS